jgi:predicted metalloprotease with PDZ domain
MRTLYQKFYQQKKRGFTEDELKSTCEMIAGCSLDEFFEYVYTVKEVNYPKYLAYAGLTIDTSLKALPGAWLGITARDRKDSLVITAVDWNSPAWNAGIHAQDKILEVDGKKIAKKQFDDLIAGKSPGDKIKLLIQHNGDSFEKEITVSTKMEKPFTITPVADPDPLQKAIFKSWKNE